MVESKKCEPGCGCARHKSSKCVPGCNCARHTSFKQGALGRTCPEGCTCGRHSRPWKIDWNSSEAKRAYAREYARQRRNKDPERFRKIARERAQANPYYAKYRLSKQDWAKMVERQSGLCYLCGKALDLERKRSVHVDHDHDCCRTERTCGKCIRGLACRNCNQGIGYFSDDPVLLRQVADALEVAQAELLARRSAEEKTTE